jgi:hypothetical protein
MDRAKSAGFISEKPTIDSAIVGFQNYFSFSQLVDSTLPPAACARHMAMTPQERWPRRLF